MLRLLLLLPLLGAAGTLPAPLRRRRRSASLPVGPYLTRYLSQQIDHFGFDENGTFQQRYLVADQYWKKGSGPILFYTGNEGDIEWFCNNTVRGGWWGYSPACR